MRGLAAVALFAVGCAGASGGTSAEAVAQGGAGGGAGARTMSAAGASADAGDQAIARGGASSVSGAAGAPGGATSAGTSSGGAESAGANQGGAESAGSAGRPADGSAGAAQAGAGGAPVNQCTGFTLYTVDVNTCLAVTGDYELQSDPACSPAGVIQRDHCATCASWSSPTPIVVMLSLAANATTKRYNTVGGVCPSNCKYICN